MGLECQGQPDSRIVPPGHCMASTYCTLLPHDHPPTYIHNQLAKMKTLCTVKVYISRDHHAASRTSHNDDGGQSGCALMLNARARAWHTCLPRYDNPNDWAGDDACFFALCGHTCPAARLGAVSEPWGTLRAHCPLCHPI